MEIGESGGVGVVCWDLYFIGRGDYGFFIVVMG